MAYRKATPEETAKLFGMKPPTSSEQNSPSETLKSDSVDENDRVEDATPMNEQDSSDPVFNFETFELPFMSHPYSCDNDGVLQKDQGCHQAH